MEPKGFHRKLTAILSADVAGYSRLMLGDQAATIKTLETYKQIISKLVKQHRSRAVASRVTSCLRSSPAWRTPCSARLQRRVIKESGNAVPNWSQPSKPLGEKLSLRRKV